jgi:hypothetical protein
MVTGTIRYGKLVIEEGGQLSGEISLADTVTPAKPAAVQSRIPNCRPCLTNAGAATGLACGLQCCQQRHSQRQCSDISTTCESTPARRRPASSLFHGARAAPRPTAVPREQKPRSANPPVGFDARRIEQVPAKAPSSR